MKKLLIALAATAMAGTGFAQEKFISSALTAANEKNWEEAKTDIDRAQANPETKDKPKTLYAKSQIYYNTIVADRSKESVLLDELTKTELKLMEVKADYEKADMNTIMVPTAFMNYNAGAGYYNDHKNQECINAMTNVIKIHDLGGGKRFEKVANGKKLDTTAAFAAQMIAKTYYFSQDYANAITAYNKMINNPITKSVENYNILLDAYDKYNTNNGNKMAAEQLAAIQQASAAYPNDANVKSSLLNYYIQNNKLSELEKALADAVAKDPNNAEAQLNLAMVYQGLASPKDGKKPANAAEYNAKAEAAFARAVELAPENMSAQFNCGVLYYNNGVEINEEMAKLGTSDADNKKYDELRVKRDAQFDKAMPRLEKVYATLSAKAELNTDEKDMYRNDLSALKQMYGAKNNVAKMKEMNDKLSALDAAH